MDNKLKLGLTAVALFIVTYFGVCFTIGAPSGIFIWKTNKAVSDFIDSPTSEKNMEEKLNRLDKELSFDAKYGAGIMKSAAGEKK